MATIKLKGNTTSDIFRGLNSHSRQHALYRTLKAFGQIIKSLFILRYVDDLTLRQAIEKQLNKVELANHFTRVMAVGNPREYSQVEKEEQEIAEACSRLIKNRIICWNYLYLARQSRKLRTPKLEKSDRGPLAHVMGPHQHARSSAPEKGSMMETQKTGDGRVRKSKSIQCYAESPKSRFVPLLG